MASHTHWTKHMTPHDKAFYQALGKRIAQYRKEQGLTQQQLADTLDISQQTLAHYEVGRLRVAVSMLSQLAKILSISVEDLLEEAPEPGKSRRGPPSRVLLQLEQIAQMPRTKQKFISDMLDAFIQQQQAS